MHQRLFIHSYIYCFQGLEWANKIARHVTQLHSCPNPQTAYHQNWTTVYCGLWGVWRVSIGSSAITNVSFWWAILRHILKKKKKSNVPKNKFTFSATLFFPVRELGITDSAPPFHEKCSSLVSLILTVVKMGCPGTASVHCSAPTECCSYLASCSSPFS